EEERARFRVVGPGRVRALPLRPGQSDPGWHRSSTHLGANAWRAKKERPIPQADSCHWLAADATTNRYLEMLCAKAGRSGSNPPAKARRAASRRNRQRSAAILPARRPRLWNPKARAASQRERRKS